MYIDFLEKYAKSLIYTKYEHTRFIKYMLLETIKNRIKLYIFYY